MTASIAPAWHAPVEQARARGLTVEQTVVELGVHPRKVLAVWAAMDEAVDDDASSTIGVCARAPGRRR